MRKVNGVRAERLTSQEVPSLAVAIVASIRGKCTVQNFTMDGERCIRLFGDGFNVVVRGSDWLKIVPYLVDGSFEPTVIPIPQVVMLEPDVQRDVALVTVLDSHLYNRVLTVLSKLFPIRYPTPTQ